ncbi:MAG: response regulator transcription factor [Rhodobacteraceae bacterium]|jgi:DNA-binding NarL/FixJ family response regulator|nr:response regulator transcription factor [Paracoccaceae bacterium]
MDQRANAATHGDVSSVLIVDDHPLYRDALASAIQLVFPNAEIAQTETLSEAMGAIEDGVRPDLVMFDLKLPDVCGISGFLSLRDQLPTTPILVISALASVELVQTLMREGAVGFLPKETSAQHLKEVLSQVGAGQTYVPAAYRSAGRSSDISAQNEPMHPRLAALTPQQRKIMKLICAGKANKQIAYELSLAEATVKAHITALLRRLGVRNRTQAAVLVESEGPAQLADSGDPEAQAFLSR